MRKFRKMEARGQISMFPRSLDEYVSIDDSVRYVDALVEEFDLSEIESAYSHIGRPAYAPAMLIKVLLYGKMRGIRSSRELARACRENVRFMYLAQNEQPDFRTIITFRKTFIKELGSLLSQTVRIGLKEGVIKLENVAIDGTKLRANAAAKSFKSPERLEEILNVLESSFKEDVAVDEREDAEHGSDDGEQKLPNGMRGKQELLERVREALKRDENEVQSKKCYSTTDADATFMKGPEGKRPSYNAQVAVDASSMMVVGADVTTAGTDQNQLKPVLESVKEETGEKPKAVLADKGYGTVDALRALEDRDINGFIPLQDGNKGKYNIDHFVYDEENDEFICPDGRTLIYVCEKGDTEEYQSEDCSGCARQKQCLKSASRRSLKVSDESALLTAMRQKMSTSEGKEKLKLRAQTVELLFAWLKARKKLRQFMFRGLNLVKHEWKFELAALNFERLLKIRMKTA